MSGSENNTTASLARELAAPTRFRCKVGGEWKPLSSFSKTQQNLVQGQIDRRVRINAANTGMTCRDHSGVPRAELRCDVCTLIKPVSEFSRNNRRADDPVCKRCAAWSETQEPEVTPARLETGHISIEETGNEVWQKSYTESNDFFTDDTPQAPITELSSLGLEGNEVLSKLKAASAGMSNRASSVVSAGSSLPPHLRAKEPQSAPSASGASTADAADSASGILSASLSTATTMRDMAIKGRGSENRVTYNAWGPDGKQHKGVKNPTVPSTTDGGSGAGRDQGRLQDKPNAQGKAPSQGNPTTRKGGWAKGARLSRAELCAQPVIPHVSARHHDANVDRLLRMNYCDTEDSDF